MVLEAVDMGVARSNNVGWTHGDRADSEPIPGSGAEPPAGSMGRAPGQGVRGEPPEAETF